MNGSILKLVCIIGVIALAGSPFTHAQSTCQPDLEPGRKLSRLLASLEKNAGTLSDNHLKRISKARSDAEIGCEVEAKLINFYTLGALSLADPGGALRSHTELLTLGHTTVETDKNNYPSIDYIVSYVTDVSPNMGELETWIAAGWRPDYTVSKELTDAYLKTDRYDDAVGFLEQRLASTPDKDSLWIISSLRKLASEAGDESLKKRAEQLMIARAVRLVEKAGYDVSDPTGATTEDWHGAVLVAPEVTYPPRAVAQKLEGNCDVAFSVDLFGRPYDVAAQCTDDVFKRYSERAIQRAAFAPSFVDGQLAERRNVVYPVVFSLDAYE